jgi:hypothetical protein
MALGAVWLSLTAGLAHGVQITYLAQDLADPVKAQDLWQYRYEVTGSFSSGDGFRLLFAPSLYSSLDPGPNPDSAVWDLPDPQPDGVFMATAAKDVNADSELFILNFVWSGGESAPGPQPFELLNASSDAARGGETTAAPTLPNQIPEPASGGLVASAVAALLMVRHRKARTTGRYWR